MQNISAVKKIGILFLVIGLIFQFTSCNTLPEKKEGIIELIKAGKAEELKERFNEDSINMTDENGYSLLHIAVLQNNPVIVRFLLSMNANIEAADPSGKTPLLLGLNRECYEAVKVLIEHNANIFAKDKSGVHSFSYSQEKEAVRFILTSKTIRQKDEALNTALHYAAKELKPNLVKAISDIEKPLTEKNAEGKTPLNLVYENTESEAAAEIASMLIIAGLEPEGKEFTEFETASLARNYSMRFGDGETLLHICSRKGYTGFVRFLINKNVPIDVKNMASSTALHEAVRSGKIETASLLIKSGADPNARDASGNTALHLVMPEASRSKLFSELLASGAKPNIKDNYGETPLHVAVRIGMEDNILQQLIEAGADINERNKKGQTPLILAIERNLVNQVKSLIKYGSDIHAEDTAGDTAFTKALSIGLPMVQNVITDTNSMYRDSNGSTPLHIAISRKASTDIIYYLVEKKSLVNTRDKAGNTALHIAAEQNYREAGEILLANNADIFYANVKGESPLKLAMLLGGGREDWIINSHTISAKDGAGNTPLHLASEWKVIPMILYLLDKGADINARNSNNETPLFSAVKGDSPEAIRTLLGAGGGIKADINARDFLGNSVLHATVKWSAYNSAALLLSMTSDGFTSLIYSKNLAGKTVLHEAAKQGNIAFIKTFLNARADINAADEIGRSPLTEAVLTNKLDAVNLLLTNGASPVQQDMYGRTPLHEAVIMGNIDCIFSIRKAGGNPLARDAYSKTPFLLSLSKGIQIIDAVLGTDKFLADTDGDTPVHIAVSENVSADIFQALLSKGYPVDKRNKNGTVAVLAAVQKNQKENTHLLLIAGADPFIINNQGVCAVGEIFTKHPDFVPLAAEFAVGRTDVMGDGLLHYAAKFASVQIIRELLTLPGVSVNAKNTAGETPRDIALRWQREDAAEALK
ncbi:ankyrin repeat domain-containing protein [Treponema pedis]|uniref:Ankyrin repeat-containing protein n=5 Tax=Treponema pedis TaxID=409322 RepID=S6A2J8_9SPIR|nr:ankyrin repeat domain-containing protein [Treponema pedis]AGT42736.1 ankyrin repeat-containing protein [Treponema pedis str. T A4]